jgi:hypothetical protein
VVLLVPLWQREQAAQVPLAHHRGPALHPVSLRLPLMCECSPQIPHAQRCGCRRATPASMRLSPSSSKNWYCRVLLRPCCSLRQHSMHTSDRAAAQAKTQPGTCHEQLLLAEYALCRACEKGEVGAASDPGVTVLVQEVFPVLRTLHQLALLVACVEQRAGMDTRRAPLQGNICKDQPHPALPCLHRDRRETTSKKELIYMRKVTRAFPRPA